jgi:hypothetical protein
MTEIPDGLEALGSVMSLREVASFIERTARWVAPETFELLPVLVSRARSSRRIL